MKKIILSTTILLLITFQTQAQWFFGGEKGNGIMVTKTRTVKNYDKILVTGSFNVALVHGKEGELSIKMEENLVDFLITEVKDNKLIIKWKNNVNIRTQRGVHIVVPFKDLNEVKLTGSGDVVSSDIIRAVHFETLVSGSGNVALNINAKSIKSKVTGSGGIQLYGSTDNLNTLVTGSGDFNSYKLTAENVNATVTGSGDIQVIASKKLNAKVTGSGDITYKGNPEIQDFKITGSGDIESK